jgi:hypothetical protein
MFGTLDVDFTCVMCYVLFRCEILGSLEGKALSRERCTGPNEASLGSYSNAPTSLLLLSSSPHHFMVPWYFVWLYSNTLELEVRPLDVARVLDIKMLPIK